MLFLSTNGSYLIKYSMYPFVSYYHTSIIHVKVLQMCNPGLLKLIVCNEF
jgi:hypothetical protein